MKIFFTFAALILLYGSILGQTKPVCEGTTNYVIDPHYPSVFLQFERFGRFEPTISDDLQAGQIEKGEDVWLSIHNNSCWDISFEGHFVGLGINGEKGWRLKKAGIGTADYITIEPNGRYVPAEPERRDARIIMQLAPGASMLFPVKRKQLLGRFIYVSYTYGWEGISAGNPEHSAFFRRDIKELESK